MHALALALRLAPLAMTAAVAPAPATTITLIADLDDVAAVDLTVLAQGKALCTLHKAADEKAPGSATCRIEFTPGMTTWQVKGAYRLPGLLQRARKVEQTIKLLDFAVASRNLSGSDRPYGERMAAFIKATEQFVKAQLPDHYALIEAGKPADTKTLAMAATRVGFALPPEFVSLQRSVGALRISDHSLMGVNELHDAYTQMRQVWGTPEEAMQSDYSEKFRTMLKQSTLLFTEVGDGYGGLLYRPGKTQACGEAGIYYWTSQEGGTDVLKNADGSCMDFSAAMRWIVDGFVVDEFAETVSEELPHTVLLDSSSAVPEIVLTPSTGDSVDVTLRGKWPGPHN
jgi:hypothetical protein